jgi:hypothetical protein
MRCASGSAPPGNGHARPRKREQFPGSGDRPFNGREVRSAHHRLVQARRDCRMQRLRLRGFCLIYVRHPIHILRYVTFHRPAPAALLHRRG